MDLIWSLGLIVVILLALNHMSGGRASNVLRPMTKIASDLIALAVRAVLSVFGTVFRIGAGSVRLPKSGVKPNDDKHGPGPPPPRWD